MSIENGSFELPLRRAIEVHGVNVPVETLTFHECGEGYDGYYLKLRKFVSSAQMRLPEMAERFRSFLPAEMLDDDGSLKVGTELKKLHEVKEDDHADDAQGIADFLKTMLGTSDELEDLVQTFGRMVCHKGANPVCTADGERVKEGAWRRVHVEDKIDAAVKYCAFFGIGSDKPAKTDFAVASGSHTAVKAL